MTAPWGAGALHQRLNAFVKKSLIQQLVPPGAVVCDLYCGRGVDTENWGEAKIGKYVGVDLSSSALEEAKEEWERNEKPFVARFCELNPCMADLEKHLGVERLSVDVVTCLSHLQDCFASEDMVRQLLKNVTSLLKPGGYFFGATPDSSTIWYKYQKAVEGAMKAGSLRANGHLPRVRTELYSISFEDDRFNEYGSRYQLRFTDESVPPHSQILVHFPSLIRRAEELGLECVEIQNLTEFYEDYRVPFAETLQKSCGTLVDAKGHPVVDGKSRLSPVTQDVLSLYTTFIFKKPDPQQRERALKRPAAPTPAPADVKKNKKFSPALPIQIAAPEERPSKKQRLSASPAVTTSNGSKIQEINPKQEKSSSSVSRPKPGIVSKIEPARSSVNSPKPSGEPKLGSSHVNMSESKSQEKVLKPDTASSEARGRTSVERIQKTESPSVSKPKGVGGQRIESPSASKLKPSEEGQRNDLSLNLGAQELQAESFQPSKRNMQGSSDPDTDRPSSSGLLSESNRRSRNESGQAQEPFKRKRVSRWSSDYVPKLVSSSAGQNTERKDEGVTLQHSDQGLADKKASGTPARSQMEGDVVSSLASSVREAQLVSGAQQLRDSSTTARDGKPQHDGKFNHKEGNQGFYKRKSPLSKQEPREEGEVASEDPVCNFASPKRERRVVTGPHYEGRAAQGAVVSETVSGRYTESIRSETQFNGSVVQNSESKVGPAIHKNSVAGEFRSQRVAASRGEGLASDAHPREGSTQTTTAILEPEGKTMDQGKCKSDEPTNQHKGIGASSSTQKNGSTAGNSDGKKESVNPKPRKKEIAMDVLLDRTSNQSTENAATCATQAVATIAAEFASEKAAMKKNDSYASNDPELARGPDQKKDPAVGDMDFERGSKLSRDSPAGEQQPEAGFIQKRESGTVLEPTSDVGRRDSFGSRRELEPAWETKPQRYTLRRAASQLSEGVESPPLWSRGTFTSKVDREHQGRGPVFHPRVPYVNPVSGFGAGLRAPLRAEERRVVPPLPGGAGLLGAAPSPIFGDRGLPGDRRFDMMGPPEGGRGFSLSQNDLRVPRPSIRGSLYKNDRVLPAGPRGPNSDFAGEGPHIPSVSNGLGAPWEDHFQGDGRSRINR